MDARTLTSVELKEISAIMDELLSDPVVRIKHKFSGGFSDCILFDYDDEYIDIELKFGVQDDTGSNVTTEQYKIDRETMQLSH